MATDSRIGILFEARDQATGVINNVKTGLGGINQAAGLAAGGIGALAAAAGAAALVDLGRQGFQLAESAAQAERTRQAFDNLAAGVGESGDQMLAALQKASNGQIANTELILSANRAMLLGVADSSDQLAKLLEVARVRGQAMGLSVQQAFSDLVTGLGRMSPLILDNLGIVTGGEKVFEQYAASLHKTADALTDAERKQALYNKVVSETQPLIDAAGTGTDAAGRFEQLGTSIENLKVAIGDLINNSGLPEFLSELATRINEVNKLLTESRAGAAENTLFRVGPELTKTAEEYRKALEDFQNAAITGGAAAGSLEPLAGVISSTGDRLKELAAEYNEAAKVTGADLIDVNALAAGEVAFVRVGQAINKTTEAAPAAAEGMDKFTNASTKAGANALQAALAIDQLNAAAQRAAANMAAIDSAVQGAVSGLASKVADLSERGLVDPDQAFKIFTEGAAKATRQAQVLRQELKDGNLTQEEFTFQMAFLGQTADDQAVAIDEADQAAKRYAKTLEGDAKRAANEAEQAFDKLKNKVAGVLTGALDTGVDVNPEEILSKFGLRPDAINENARRLADIVKNGFKGQDWLDEFEKEVPDTFKRIIESANPQAEAARLLQEFQQGLRPELIDKEKAKDLVRRMILGEQSIDQMATEIASELAAEFGAGTPGNIGQLVDQALGRGAAGAGAGTQGGAQAGADAANSFAASFVSAASTVGQQIANALKTESVIALISDAAKAAGTAWGNSFLSVVGDNVPAALVELLTDLVTPGVQARLATQASLTGAK